MAALRPAFATDPNGVAPLVLAGSYFSDKPNPDDIETTLMLHATELQAAATCTVMHYRFHAAWKANHRVDYYPTFPGQYDFREFFQYVGVKTGAAKGLQPRERRGVVQVDAW